MSWLILYRISASLLALGALAHTFGGMLGTAKRGPGAGPEADKVLAAMKAVHFNWRGKDCTWYGFWMGNGLGVSALLLPVITVLWVLGGLDLDQIRPVLPIAWAAFASLTLLAFFGFKYFGSKVGSVFALVALLSGIAVVLSTMAGVPPTR